MTVYNEAEKALHLLDTDTQHLDLLNQQGPLIEDAWVEFYEVLEFKRPIGKAPLAAGKRKHG